MIPLSYYGVEVHHNGRRIDVPKGVYVDTGKPIPKKATEFTLVLQPAPIRSIVIEGTITI